MANMSVDGFDSLQKQLDNLANIEQYAKPMLEAAAPVLQKSLQKAIQRHSSAGRTVTYDNGRTYTQTGGLADSFRIGKVKTGKRGTFVNVIADGYNDRPTPAHKKGQPYAAIAASIEYGNSRQVAEPFAQQAANDCADDVAKAMQGVITEVYGQ